MLAPLRLGAEVIVVVEEEVVEERSLTKAVRATV